MTSKMQLMSIQLGRSPDANQSSWAKEKIVPTVRQKISLVY